MSKDGRLKNSVIDVADVRRKMKAACIKAVIVPMDDQVQESPEWHPERRFAAALTGYEGEAGVAVVTPDTKAIIVPNTHLGQAVGSPAYQNDWKIHIPDQGSGVFRDDLVQTLRRLLTGELGSGENVRADPGLAFTHYDGVIRMACASAGFVLPSYNADRSLLAPLWQNRPERHIYRWASQETESGAQGLRTRLDGLRDRIAARGGDVYLTTDTKEIAHLLDLDPSRYAPARGYEDFMAIYRDGTTLLYTEAKIPESHVDILYEAGVRIGDTLQKDGPLDNLARWGYKILLPKRGVEEHIMREVRTRAADGLCVCHISDHMSGTGRAAVPGAQAPPACKP